MQVNVNFIFLFFFSTSKYLFEMKIFVEKINSKRINQKQFITANSLLLSAIDDISKITLQYTM
jgi:hypothetical protein